MNKKHLLILILAILADVVCNNSIIQAFQMQTFVSAIVLTVIMLGLQTVTAPIQAGFSDFYCRKKSLIVALTFSFISLLLFSVLKTGGSIALIALWIGVIFNACLGNTVPIAWSALADSQVKNLRFFLALTTSAYAVGYMVLAIFSQTVPQEISKFAWVWQDIVMPMILIGISIPLIWKYFIDSKDKRLLKNSHHHFDFFRLAGSEFSALADELRSSTTRCGILAYFLWAASQYSTLLWLVGNREYAWSIVFMMTGYFTGVVILYFCRKISDQTIIKSAFVITVLAVLFFFIANTVYHRTYAVLSISYFFYTMGNAFLTPSIFSLFSKERQIHEQGKGFGLIVSADSAGFLVAILAVQLFERYNLGLEAIVLLSLILFLISWVPYSLYDKRRKDVARME